MPRKGENIHKRKDGRWEARYIKGYGEDGKAVYGYVFGESYLETKRKKNDVVLPTQPTVPTVGLSLSSASSMLSVGFPFAAVPPVTPVTQIVQVGGNVNVYSANTTNNVLLFLGLEFLREHEACKSTVHRSL